MGPPFDCVTGNSCDTIRARTLYGQTAQAPLIDPRAVSPYFLLLGTTYGTICTPANVHIYASTILLKKYNEKSPFGLKKIKYIEASHVKKPKTFN